MLLKKIFCVFSLDFLCQPILGKMADKMADKNREKIEGNFHCIKCDYKCSYDSDYVKHKMTAKHKRLTLADAKNRENRVKLNNATSSGYICDCGKEYKHRQSLHKHQHKCKYVKQDKVEEVEENTQENAPEKIDNSNYKELFFESMKQTNTLIEKLAERDMIREKQMSDIIPLIGNNNNNTTNNTTNNFNLNFFLNNDCKDALNLTDFINSLQLQLEDLEYTADNGYIEGITNIFQKALSNMEVTKRPMHCTDLKRETLYIKDNDEWHKDETKDGLKSSINTVANKNIVNTGKWLKKYPEHVDAGSKDFERYVKMTSNSMGTGEELEQNKITKNIMKEVIIDKNKI